MASDKSNYPSGMKKSVFIWSVGAGVYMLAVFHRTSLGVAGPEAQDRFSISPSQLSAFVMLQLAVYAAMQVPAGILIDRLGPRRMLLASTLLMGTAQITFALVPSFPLALLARGLLGCGDALAYLSVLRLVAGWFPAKKYSIFTAFSGLFGVTGNIIATVPLTALLRGYGWTPTFLVAGCLSIVYAVVLVRPATAAPYQGANPAMAQHPARKRHVWAEVKLAWAQPGGRLGFWVHFTTMCGPTTFAVLWGFPYLTQGLDYSAGTASSLLLVLVITQLVGSLTVGNILGRRPSIRTPIAFGASIGCIVSWLVFILWPGGHPPLVVVVVMIVVLAVGGPSSMVAFMLARDYNPHYRISTATGLVNTGGFIGTVLAVLIIGQILDLLEPDASESSVAAFRWAFVGVALMTSFGLFRLTIWWIRARAVLFRMQAAGDTVPFFIRRHRFDLVPEGTAVPEEDRHHDERNDDIGPAADR